MPIPRVVEYAVWNRRKCGGRGFFASFVRKSGFPFVGEPVPALLGRARRIHLVKETVNSQPAVRHVYNFSAGPVVLPKEVLRQAADEMLDWHGSGMSVMEMSHRGPEFMAIYRQAEADLRELLAVPANYKILFMQGGGLGMNAIIPMNLVGRKPQPATVDFVQTGSWSTKSLKEAARYATVNVAVSGEASGWTTVPPQDSWTLSDNAAYLHLCTNETIDGVEIDFAPTVQGDTVLVADMSSHILSRVVDVSKYGVIFAGAQKNIGPAGLTIAIVRDDLLGSALPICPSVFDWKKVADNDSMLNTPPTYGIYIAGLVFQHLKRQGGVAAMERKNIEKARLSTRRWTPTTSTATASTRPTARA